MLHIFQRESRHNLPYFLTFSIQLTPVTCREAKEVQRFKYKTRRVWELNTDPAKRKESVLSYIHHVTSEPPVKERH